MSENIRRTLSPEAILPNMIKRSLKIKKAQWKAKKGQ